jgi:hypothetical protein
MDSKKMKNYVDLIAYGFKRMEEGHYVHSPIYSFMAESIVTPMGTKIKTNGIHVSRLIKNGGRYFEINYNKRRHLLLPAYTVRSIEAAVIWMETNNCLPNIKAFKTVIIKAQFLKV